MHRKPNGSLVQLLPTVNMTTGKASCCAWYVRLMCVLNMLDVCLHNFVLGNMAENKLVSVVSLIFARDR